MSEHRTSTPRSRGLKTWTAFGDLGRRPTEYEILTHGLNHTMGVPALELPPSAHGNRWLADHRDMMRLAAPDWNAFRDPDAMTYGSYVALQDDQETYVEGLIERFDRDDQDAALPARVLEFLALTLTPCRYLAHVEQMLSAYLQQLAPSSYIANCATFQTADQLRRVQLVAYRTTQLQRAYPERGFATGERTTWEQHPDWQPIRQAAELALVEYDWDRALVATQLVVKPVADLIFLDQLGQELAATGAGLDSLIAENLWQDCERSRRWTAALLRFLTEADGGNLPVLQEYLRDWAARGYAMAEAGAELLTAGGGRSSSEIRDRVIGGWAQLIEPAGLSLDPA